MGIVVQDRLPREGSTWLQQRSTWEPLFNLVRGHGPGHGPDGRPLFPLDGGVTAASSRAFLASLGRPLAIAHCLESEPGVWWLVDEPNKTEWLIWSDSHRKNAWKGGQICLLAERPIEADDPGLIELRAEVARLWGMPRKPLFPRLPFGDPDMLDYFEKASARGIPPAWPRGHGGAVIHGQASEPRRQRRCQTGR